MFLLRDHMVHIVTGSLFVGLLECSRPKVPPPIPKKKEQRSRFRARRLQILQVFEFNSPMLGWFRVAVKGWYLFRWLSTHDISSSQVATHCIIPTCASYRRAKWFYQLPCSGWFCKLFQCFTPLFGGFCLPCPELIQIVGWSLLSPFHLHESSSTLVFVLNFGSVFTPCTSSSQI